MEKYFKLCKTISKKYSNAKFCSEDIEQHLLLKLCYLKNHHKIDNERFISTTLNNICRNYIRDNSKFKLSIKERKLHKDLTNKTELTKKETTKLNELNDNRYFNEIGFESEDEQAFYINHTPSYDDKIILNDIMNKLSEKSRDIICRFYINNQTDKEISEIYNTTKDSIRNKRVKTLKTIRIKLEEIGYTR